MTSAAPEGSFPEGVPSLEVRWILPGQLDTAVAAWFGTSVSRTESREDIYLLRPDLGALSVKVRGGRALEVKVFRGSPGILDLPGRAHGRMQYWQKWSFPYRSLSPHARETDGWIRVRKQRRTIRFSLTGGPIACVGEPAGTGGLLVWKRPVPPDCSAPGSRPPRRWYSPKPCRAAWNSAWLTPCRTPTGFAAARAPRGNASF